ncbi:MAG TPA: SLBB domain-containing protein [Ignavibacteriaceae bacterium]|nr:SLBB domain-containing protein [Ignavibacteriaceae bacterium]
MIKSYIKYFLFLIILLFSKNVFAQIPDYKERSYSVFSDSNDTENEKLLLMEATEGSIDPEAYLMGPGDKIFISILGIQDISSTLLVNQEGILYIPKVGSVDLNNLNLKTAKEKIKNKIFQYYKDVEVSVSLADFRKIKVSLIGQVKKPASYTLTANARLLDLISLSNGFLKEANYRNIKVVNNNDNTKYYDIVKYLRYADKNNNPFLHEGDVVIVDKVDLMVSISGEVKFPGSYEFIENEKVIDFINLSGGLLSKAKKDTIEVVSFEPDGKNQISHYYSLDELTNNNIILKKQDQVIIRKYPDYLEDKFVYIEGFVKYPGYYKIVEDKTTLTQIIKESGGLREAASLFDASLTRNIGSITVDPEFERLKTIPRADMSDDEYDYFKAKSRQRKGKVVIDFVDVFEKNNVREDITLKKGDVIFIPEKKDYIIMLGQVIKPGNIVYDKNLNYREYINLAGGYGWRALDNQVRIIRANTGEWVEADEDIILQPGDAIWVPEDPPGKSFWELFTTSLSVLGQVASVVAAIVAVIIVSR